MALGWFTCLRPISQLVTVKCKTEVAALLFEPCFSLYLLTSLHTFSEQEYSLIHSSIRDAKIATSERVKSGVTGEQLWLQINEPTEKDKGKYTMDIFDGKDGVKRVFDLTGQGE